jgi:hypothetical protein
MLERRRLRLLRRPQRTDRKRPREARQWPPVATPSDFACIITPPAFTIEQAAQA